MERSRTAPPTSSSEDEGVSLPEGPLPEALSPLASLIEQVRAPSAGSAEIDALLAGLSQPLPPEHSPRERADLLLSLIGDGLIASYAGTSGQTVRTAAIQALIALGYPYALEVPPEALEAKSREEELARPGILSTTKGRTGFGLVTLAGVLQSLAVAFLGIILSAPTFMAVALSIIAAMTLLPATLAVLGQSLGSRSLKNLSLAWLKVSASLWGGLGILLAGSGILSPSGLALILVPLLMAALIYFGARFMGTKDDR